VSAFVEPNQNIGPLGPAVARSPVETLIPAVTGAATSSSFTWEQAVRVLRKNLRLSLFSALLMVFAVIAFAYLLKNVYRPVARLEIDPPTSGIKTLHEIEDANDTENQDYLETQVQILQSEALAIRVIRALHLDKNAEFVDEKEIAKSHATAPSARHTDDTAAKQKEFLNEQLDLADRTPLESMALDAFQKELSVNSIRNSRLIEVSFESGDARLAQLITNALVTQFMDQNYQNRYATTMEASQWLSEQLNDLRQKVQESSQEVAAYQRKYAIIDSDDKDAPIAQYMAEINHQLSDAEATRIEQEAYVRMIDTGQADSIPALREDQVYQNLLTNYADARARLAQARTIYGDENSNVKKVVNEANEIAAQLDAERARVTNQVRTSYAAARDREQMMLQARDRIRTQLGDDGSHLVEFRVLKNEALATGELYNTLQSRLKEAGIFAGLRSSNIHIVDLAAQLRKPTGPHRGPIIAIGAMVSCMLALLLAFAAESFNNTIRTPEDIRSSSGLPSLAMLPPIHGGHLFAETKVAAIRKLFVGSPSGRDKGRSSGGLAISLRSAEGEAVRDLRTRIAFTRPDAPPRVVLVASASAGEGKTTVAMNLAAACAQRGKTVLVDGDLRNPAIANVLGLEVQAGVNDVLEGTASLESVLLPIEDVPNMVVLPARPVAENPVDLIASEQMRSLITTLRNGFEHVVIDSPPTIPYSDTRILSSLSDGVVVVARYGLTTQRALARCVELLDEARAPVAGVVLNGINPFSPDYQYYNYGFSRSMNGQRYYCSESPAPQQAADQTPPPDEEPKQKSASA